MDSMEYSPKDSVICLEFCLSQFNGSWRIQIISRHPVTHSFPYRFRTQTLEGTTAHPTAAQWDTLISNLESEIRNQKLPPEETDHIIGLLKFWNGEKLSAAMKNRKEQLASRTG